ncbi:prolipoprotein diacylglyceryl transferase [Alteraurantiacibacter aestuarii]|uniref:Phosphatidylglycerol--prolipoprotein diacylglyceryl transferase n=1 Tax=Alteraurantiacibacter aestuarii TaxID=650004 RepID=A0A844ZND9_9SPHN|nr:prolipoprotein diacylglyceryl transferase [Alteraurantiacibacter aestuarii]MXO88357.1 prolipoprotein diacylglyceryl transferase [Alteraurantiacibacter aestuarii]
MLEFLAVATGGTTNWIDLGLKNGIDLGIFTLRYYSLAYLFGLFFAYWHLSLMIKAPGAPLAQRHADDLFFYCMVGTILGGRLGYATFYQPELWTTFEPDTFISWRVLRLWDGGMSFHGGVIGVTTAIGWVSWRGQLNFIRVCDYIAVNVGPAMLLGRLANFINGELWGRAAPADLPWAMTFCDIQHSASTCISSYVPRHPSQLYEALLEGALVAAVLIPLFWFSRARYRPGLLVGTFTVLIASGRFIVEFFREPDAQLAEFAVRTGLNMGQWLTIPLILGGLGLVIWALTRTPLASGHKRPAG